MSSLLKKIQVSVILLLLLQNAPAADPFRIPAGAREAGMANVSITSPSFWSSFHNQALLGNNKSFMAGFSYENRFGVYELGNRTAAIILPAGRTSLGAVYNYFGYHDFNRQLAGLACGMKLSDKISAGIQADYLSERTFGEYQNINILTFEAGISVQAGDNAVLAAHIFNPLMAVQNRYKVPTRLRIGAGAKLSSSVFAGIEAEMSSNSTTSLHAGMEYEAFKKFFLRGGFNTENNSFAMGLGYRLSFLQLDLGFVTHDRLGVSSSASLIFLIKN